MLSLLTSTLLIPNSLASFTHLISSEKKRVERKMAASATCFEEGKGKKINSIEVEIVDLTNSPSPPKKNQAESVPAATEKTLRDKCDLRDKRILSPKSSDQTYGRESVGSACNRAPTSPYEALRIRATPMNERKSVVSRRKRASKSSSKALQMKATPINEKESVSSGNERASKGPYKALRIRTP